MILSADTKGNFRKEIYCVVINTSLSEIGTQKAALIILKKTLSPTIILEVRFYKDSIYSQTRSRGLLSLTVSIPLGSRSLGQQNQISKRNKNRARMGRKETKRSPFTDNTTIHREKPRADKLLALIIYSVKALITRSVSKYYPYPCSMSTLKKVILKIYHLQQQQKFKALEQI